MLRFHEKQISASNITLKDDVTQRTQELESERLFVNKILDNAGALIVILDQDGHIIRFNAAYENITGFSFEQLRNRPIWEWLIPPEQLKRVQNVFNKLSHEGLESQYKIT